MKLAIGLVGDLTILVSHLLPENYRIDHHVITEHRDFPFAASALSSTQRFDDRHFK